MVKDDHLDRGPEDHSTMADEYPSPEASNANLADPMDMSSQLANQAAAQAQALAEATASSSATQHVSHTVPSGSQHQQQQQQQQQHHHHPHYQNQHASSSTPEPPRLQANRYQPMSSNANQIKLLRDFYSHNPNPSKQDLEVLAARTGRPFTKVREYFRQRRNKMRGLDELERMAEPGRASGWLRVSYRPGPSTSHVAQLALYNAYKTRFDPYDAVSPLLGGQDLIELVCATFPGCEMSKAGDEYHLSGLREKEGGEGDWERTLEGVAEPVRAASWLLGTYQQTGDDSSIPQTDLYTSYALRFAAPSTNENHAGEQNTSTTAAALSSLNQADETYDLSDLDGANQLDPDLDPPAAAVIHHRLLSAVELITLARMTFPECEPAVDDDGKFVIRGLERREGVEKGWTDKSAEMFPFALMSEPRASDPDHPMTNLLKRKLISLNPDGPGDSSKKAKPATLLPTSLATEDRELLDGLRRFKDSDLGKEVRDICVNQ